MKSFRWDGMGANPSGDAGGHGRRPGERDRLISVQPRVALVHDFFVSIRGADRVFLEMCDLYPDADIYLPIYDEQATGGVLRGRRVHTSFLQRLRPSARTFRALLPFYPAAIESFDLTGYDLVVSSSSAWAHAVICDESAVHVCYCYNPFRYVWNERHRTLAERRNPLARAALRHAVAQVARVGLDRRPAGGPLRGHLEHHQAPDPQLLRP